MALSVAESVGLTNTNYKNKNYGNEYYEADKSC